MEHLKIFQLQSGKMAQVYTKLNAMHINIL